MAYKCPKCGSKKEYSKDYDSYFCKKCNTWLEPHCTDQRCDFCKRRPAKPNFKEFHMVSQDKVNSLYNEMKEFVEEILGYDIDGIIITDLSSLGDFIGSVGSLESMTKKIDELYKIDITPIKDKPLVEIVESLKKKGIKFKKYSYKNREAYGGFLNGEIFKVHRKE